jgi:hypothetical protein
MSAVFFSSVFGHENPVSETGFNESVFTALSEHCRKGTRGNHNLFCITGSLVAASTIPSKRKPRHNKFFRTFHQVNIFS